VRIHYEVEGTGSPFVLQHGITDGLESWYEYGFVDALRDDHTLILIDARGHGGSDKPHDPVAYGLDRVGWRRRRRTGRARPLSSPFLGLFDRRAHRLRDGQSMRAHGSIVW
jgi:pimeloyl-ACP methyl ester carboxylesterase